MMGPLFPYSHSHKKPAWFPLGESSSQWENIARDLEFECMICRCLLILIHLIRVWMNEWMHGWMDGMGWNGMEWNVNHIKYNNSSSHKSTTATKSLKRKHYPITFHKIPPFPHHFPIGLPYTIGWSPGLFHCICPQIQSPRCHDRGARRMELPSAGKGRSKRWVRRKS